MAVRQWRILVKRERGVYPGPCESCGADRLCILRQSGDRYVWTCVDGCPEEAK